MVWHNVVTASDAPQLSIPSTMPAAAQHMPPALPDGITIKLLRAGVSDVYPQVSQSLAVHYDAYLPNGKMWDSSRKRGIPLRFRLGTGQVVPGLNDAVAQLSQGMRARVTIPSEMAYGERGFPGLVPPNSAVEFDIELLEIV